MVQADVIVGEISTFHREKCLSLCYKSNGQCLACATAKRSQHVNATHRNIVVRLATVLRCVATCWVLLAQVWNWSNLSQQHPTCLTRWPNARNMLRPTMLRYVVLACCNRLAGTHARHCPFLKWLSLWCFSIFCTWPKSENQRNCLITFDTQS